MVFGGRRPSPRRARRTPKAERSGAEWVPRARRLNFGTDIKRENYFCCSASLLALLQGETLLPRTPSEAAFNYISSAFPLANTSANPRGTHSASRSPPKLRFAASPSASGYAEALRARLSHSRPFRTGTGRSPATSPAAKSQTGGGSASLRSSAPRPLSPRFARLRAAPSPCFYRLDRITENRKRSFVSAFLFKSKKIRLSIFSTAFSFYLRINGRFSTMSVAIIPAGEAFLISSSAHFP